MKNVFFGVLILLACCSDTKKMAEPSGGEFTPTKLAELKGKTLAEVSGLAASINNSKMLWAHNDSGNGAEIFLIDENLDIVLTCTLEGVENRDWEDIAVGPGPDPGKRYVYVADIGDNDAQHKFKFIYRFEEPTATAESKDLKISTFDKITFQLSDTKKDTESLFINPKTKDLYIVSKREDPVYVYELKYPYSTTAELTANKILSLPFNKIVAADISPDGNEILMKNYDKIFYWKTSAPASINDMLKQPAKEIPYEVEPQGESIAWARDGSGFYTLSEKNKNKKSYLYFYKRK